MGLKGFERCTHPLGLPINASSCVAGKPSLKSNFGSQPNPHDLSDACFSLMVTFDRNATKLPVSNNGSGGKRRGESGGEG